MLIRGYAQPKFRLLVMALWAHWTLWSTVKALRATNGFITFTLLSGYCWVLHTIFVWVLLVVRFRFRRKYYSLFRWLGPLMHGCAWAALVCCRETDGPEHLWQTQKFMRCVVWRASQSLSAKPSLTAVPCHMHCMVIPPLLVIAERGGFLIVIDCGFHRLL